MKSIASRCIQHRSPFTSLFVYSLTHHLHMLVLWTSPDIFVTSIGLGPCTASSTSNVFVDIYDKLLYQRSMGVSRSLEAEFFVHSVFCIGTQRVIPSGRQIRFSIDSSRFPHPLTLQCNEYLKAELSFFFFVEQPSVSVTHTPVNYTYMQLISRDLLCPL